MKRPGERWVLLGRRGFAVAGILLGVTLVVAGLLIHGSQDNAREELVKRFEQRADTATQIFEGVLQANTRGQVQAASRALIEAHPNAATMRRFAQNFDAVRDDLYLFDKRGAFLAAYPPEVAAQGQVVARNSEVRRGLRGIPALGDLTETGRGVPGIYLAYPFKTPHGLRVLDDVIPVKLVTNVLEPTLGKLVGDGEALFLFDSAGKTVLQIGGVASVDAESLARRVGGLQGASGSFDFGGAEQRFAAIPVKDSDARLVIVADSGDLLSPVEGNAWLTWVLLGACAVALLGAFALLNRAMTRNAELALAEQRLNDGLTGLPNRSLFVERVAELLGDRGEGSRSVVVVLDLNGFKRINDALGQDAGDRVLVQIAERLLELSPRENLARFGGDEFAAVSPDVATEASAREFAVRIDELIRRPLVVDEQEVFVEASLGIALGRPGELPEMVIESADAAMYAAKSHQRLFEIAKPEVRERAAEDLQMESELRHAIESGELVVHYQPIVELPEGRIRRVEALVRWQHPRSGLLPPGVFIPIAEQSGVIVPLGAYVLERSCEVVSGWVGKGQSITLHVNLAPRQLADPGLTDTVAGALSSSGLPPSSLCLEVTEEALARGEELALRQLAALKELGVAIAIDDFGIGYSSLGRLAAMTAVDVVKIDRSFIAALDRHRETAIVVSILDLCRSLDLDVVAEGVETAVQASTLEQLGCEQAQGFYFERPRPAADIEAALQRAVGEVPE